MYLADDCVKYQLTLFLRLYSQRECNGHYCEWSRSSTGRLDCLARTRSQRTRVLTVGTLRNLNGPRLSRPTRIVYVSRKHYRDIDLRADAIEKCRSRGYLTKIRIDENNRSKRSTRSARWNSIMIFFKNIIKWWPKDVQSVFMVIGFFSNVRFCTSYGDRLPTRL